MLLLQIDLEVSAGEKEFPVFSPEQEREIFAEYERIRDIETRNIIFMHNTGLVTPIAMRYLGRSPVMELKDLVSEGNLGLFKAIDYYRLSWGTKFSTFAVTVIDQMISKALTNTGRWARIPADMLTRVRQMIQCEKEYYAKNGEYPDYQTLFGLMDLSEKTFQTVFHARRVATVTSFEDLVDRLVSGEKRDDLVIEDILSLGTDETAIGFSALLEVQKIVENVDRVCSLIRGRYNALDSEIYLRYYGFHDKSFQRESPSSLCVRFGVNRAYVEQVRMKCNKAIRKNIPGLTLCDFSEERWSALVELSLVFS